MSISRIRVSNGDKVRIRDSVRVSVRLIKPLDYRTLGLTDSDSDFDCRPIIRAGTSPNDQSFIQYFQLIKICATTSTNVL